MSVKIGVIDVSTFSWLNQNNSEMKEGVVKLDDILLFKKFTPDRTCLLTDKSPTSNPKPLVYRRTLDVDSLINFVNTHCNTYRTESGAINMAGLHREQILQNLFKVSSVTNVKSSDVFKSTSSSCTIASKAQSAECSDHFSNKYKSIPGSSNKQMKKCDRIAVPSKEEFLHSYLKLSTPVVIENAIQHWDAFRKWSNEFLRNMYGNSSVHVKLTPRGEFEGVEHASLWENYDSFEIPLKVKEQLPYPDLVVVRPATANVKFSEFLDLMKKISDEELKNVSAYLEYSSIPEYFPDLEEDIEEFEFTRGVIQRKHLNIWLSDGNTLGKLHFDPFDNLLCQIDGTKEVILFEPHDNQRLYEGHIPEAMLSYNHTNIEFRRKTLLDSTSMVMSPVDITSPDFTRFPKFADTHPLNCTISEGDVLFMPSFWWHEVQSYPNTDTSRNVAVNLWYEPFLTKEFPCPECTLDVNPKYRHLL
ncbi:hypothetical protein FSP39_023261 [Pinctada imbricata]|uniref:JmjC domain-containing protein n=1 Tax=Pinctada imbricata TaxID=66713 RepID=A0AA88YR92_PINIB|nr:hypothetical protein FSP39_023261 [Pinctada imbricata]